jgi:hypothetical protein
VARHDNNTDSHKDIMMTLQLKQTYTTISLSKRELFSRGFCWLLVPSMDGVWCVYLACCLAIVHTVNHTARNCTDLGLSTQSRSK